MNEVDKSLIRVCDGGGETHGTGFVLSDSLAVTCAHVVKKCGAAPGGRVGVVFHVNGERREAEVLAEFWRALDGDDIAVLRLLPEGGRLPEGLNPLTLGSARHCNGHTLRTAGFAALPGGYEFAWAEGQIRGVVPHPKKQAMLQMDAKPILKGMSGAPVLDLDTQRVVGIVNEFMLDAPLQWATTSDTLAAICSDLRLHPPQAVEEYLKAVVEFCQKLPYVSLKKAVSLETVYVRQQIHQAPQSGRRTSDEETAGEEQAVPEMRSHPMTVTQALEQHSRLVVMGGPGAGKSTLLRHLVQELAEGTDEWHPHLPILVSLRGLAEREGDLTTRLREQVRAELGTSLLTSLPENFLTDWTHETDLTWLIALDGLDEIVDERCRRALIPQLERAAWPSGSRIVITTRLDTRAPLTGFTPFELLPFEPEQVKEFAHNWFRPDEARARAFLDSLQAARMGDLSATPLLLTVAATVFEQSPDVSHLRALRRSKLYGEFVRILLAEDAELNRRMKEQFCQQFGTDLGERLFKYRRKVLESIALALQEGRDVHDALIEFLHQIVGWRIQDETEEADDVLKILAQQRAGLVVRRGDRYEFIHPSFREYLAAAALAKACGSDLKKVWEHVVSRWREENWREVALFALGLLSDSDQEITPLIEQIWKEGGLYFAGAALAERMRVAEDLAGQIIWELVFIARREGRRGYLFKFNYDYKAMIILGQLRAYPRVAKDLLMLAHDKTLDVWMRVDAAVALGKLGRAEDLLALARDETISAGVRLEAASALGKLGRAEDLLPLARDETVEALVRWRATTTLGRFGDARLLPDLECIAQQDADNDVRWAAQKAVEEIRQRLSGK